MMPRLTVLTLRAALLHLLTGFTLGALLLANKGVPFAPRVWGLLPPHVEFLLAGWMAQLALAVAFWILPRYPGGSRGDERPAWAAILLLNLGVLLAAAQALVAGNVFVLTGRACQLAAGSLFAVHAWGRIRPLYPMSKTG